MSAARPTLSVIVPVYNGAAVLDRCLGSLARSTFQDYECIVVDDGSTDQTRNVAAAHGATVATLERRGGPARARNRGAEQARAEILVFLDADVCVHPDTLGQIAAHFRDHPAAAALMGSYDDTPADPGFISQYKNLFHHYVHQRSSTQAWTFWAGCGAIRRDVFREAGGFDESYARPSVEDIELGYRVRARGHRIDLNPHIQVTHLKRWTFRSLVRTDLLDRGVPWFVLMLRDRSMPRDLNVTATHRLSVVLVFMLMLLFAAFIADRAMWLPLRLASAFPRALVAAGIIGILGVLVVMNLDLYRFFARKRGVAFAAAAVPLHWLYYAYCGLAVVIGTGVYLWRRPSAAGHRPDLSYPRATR